MKSSMETLNKVSALCKRNSILNIDNIENKIVNIRYGPLGYLLKRNIYKEWLNSLVNHKETHIFPVHIEEPQHVEVNESSDYKASFVNDILDQYKATLPLVSHQLPFGLAVKGRCIDTTKKNEQNEKGKENLSNSSEWESSGILWNLEQWTCKTVAFFCDPKKSMFWFYYWQRQRYLWWRRFSAMPSHFSLSDIIQISANDQLVSVQTKFPWGMQKLESVKVFGIEESKALFSSVATTSRESESVSPGLVLCQTNLDLAVFTYICNSFEEKWYEGKLTRVLRLHYKLAPYKVSVAIDDMDSESMKKLTEVSNRLVKELKRKDVPVLPNPNFKSDLPIQLQFEQFDEMGIPYTIVLHESSLISGIAGLRNRDTTLQIRYLAKGMHKYSEATNTRQCKVEESGRLFGIIPKESSLLLADHESDMYDKGTFRVINNQVINKDVKRLIAAVKPIAVVMFEI